MSHYQQLVDTIKTDERYRANLDWGKPRRGHPEGTVRAHIAELEQNLNRLVSESDEDYWKLMLLIHVHDTFKKDSVKGVAITHPKSHASLARYFLSDFCRDSDLLNMVQYHDEPYALYRQEAFKGRFNQTRLGELRNRIKDWSLFLKFLLIDGYTDGKSTEPLLWSLEHLAKPLGLEGQMREWLARLKAKVPA